MKSMLMIVFLVASLCIEQGYAHAAAKVPGSVSYKRQQGWSEWVAHNSIEFSTGNELNRRTKTFDYDYFANYALIWFSQDQVAIVRLNEILLTGTEFKEDALRLYRIAGELTGSDQTSREWKICLTRYCL